jgi:hypothetical protein
MTADTRRETLRQFTDRRVREIATEYGVTMREVRDIYGPQWWYDQWWSAILHDARNGQEIDRRTLDTIEQHHRRYLAHDWPHSIPTGYIFPEAR